MFKVLISIIFGDRGKVAMRVARGEFRMMIKYYHRLIISNIHLEMLIVKKRMLGEEVGGIEEMFRYNSEVADRLRKRLVEINKIINR